MVRLAKGTALGVAYATGASIAAVLFGREGKQAFVSEVQRSGWR